MSEPKCYCAMKLGDKAVRSPIPNPHCPLHGKRCVTCLGTGRIRGWGGELTEPCPDCSDPSSVALAAYRNRIDDDTDTINRLRSELSATQKALEAALLGLSWGTGELHASPIACAVADAWQTVRNDDAPSDGETGYLQTVLGDQDAELVEPLERLLHALESATRGSPLRKIRP